MRGSVRSTAERDVRSAASDVVRAMAPYMCYWGSLGRKPAEQPGVRVAREWMVHGKRHKLQTHTQPGHSIAGTCQRQRWASSTIVHLDEPLMSRQGGPALVQKRSHWSCGLPRTTDCVCRRCTCQGVNEQDLSKDQASRPNQKDSSGDLFYVRLIHRVFRSSLPVPPIDLSGDDAPLTVCRATRPAVIRRWVHGPLARGALSPVRCCARRAGAQCVPCPCGCCHG